MPPLAAEIQRKLREYEAPTYGYRKGADGEIEEEVFDGSLPKGWADSPAMVGESKATKAPDTTEPDTDKFTPPYGQYSFGQLRAEFKRRTGGGPKRGTDTAGLIEALEDLDAAPEEGAD